MNRPGDGSRETATPEPPKMSSAPKIETLVLDAAPLLSLSPLRGLARTYVTIPQVIAELRDQRARQHFEQLGLIEGVNVQVRNPDAAAIATGELECI